MVMINTVTIFYFKLMQLWNGYVSLYSAFVDTYMEHNYTNIVVYHGLSIDRHDIPIYVYCTCSHDKDIITIC